jgi:hypothetical protein
MNTNRLFGLLLVLALLLPVTALWAAEGTATITDLTKAYEVWKGKGIKFVVRENGQFKTWGIGRLESWGAASKWVVRNPKGHFLVHASGKVENWKNGSTRLVLRDKKGHLLTHIGINLTSKASFAANVVGLRRLKGDHKYIAFVQETLTELLIKELKDKDTIRTKVLLDYIRKNKGKKTGMENFVPVLKALVQQLNFMATQHPDPVIESLANAAREMLKDMK